MKRGQYIRLLLSTTANPSAVIAAAKQMSLHLSAQTEESSTKDTTGDAQEFEVVGQSYEITGSGLVLTDNDALLTGGLGLNSFEDWVANQEYVDTALYWKICIMEGDNQREVVSTIASGQCKITNLQISAQNKSNATYNFTLAGFGAIVPGSD